MALKGGRVESVRGAGGAGTGGLDVVVFVFVVVVVVSVTVVMSTAAACDGRGRADAMVAVVMAVDEFLGSSCDGRRVLVQGVIGLQVKVGAGGLGELAQEPLYGGEALFYRVDLTLAGGGWGGSAIMIRGVGWTSAWLGLGCC